MDIVIKVESKGKVAAFSGDAWPHSIAVPAMCHAFKLYLGPEERKNDAGEQIYDNREYSLFAGISTEAFAMSSNRSDLLAEK